MQHQLYPCLWFNGNAKEAATFYCSVFEQSAITSENPIVVMFILANQPFMALNGGRQFKINTSVSFFVYCETAEEVEDKWKQLTAGGSALMALNSYPWSEKYGWCQDKYGVSWQLMLSKGAAQKIVPSLMFTQQQSGRTEEAINFYKNIFKENDIKMISRYEKGEGDTEGNIKHAQFMLNGQLFTAMDSSGPHAAFNEGVSIVIPCYNQQEIDHFWYRLTDGGEEGRCGWLKDKFGLSWQVVPSMLGRLMSDASRRDKVMQAFMQMKKFDIEKLEQA